MSGADIETLSISARRQAILNSAELNLSSIILSIVESDFSNSVMPDVNNLELVKKKNL
jgi:hypothetical protein